MSPAKLWTALRSRLAALWRADWPAWKAWLLDVGERSLSTFWQTVVGMALSGAVVGGFTANGVKALVGAGFASVMSVVKAAIAAGIPGTQSPASLAPDPSATSPVDGAEGGVAATEPPVGTEAGPDPDPTVPPLGARLMAQPEGDA